MVNGNMGTITEPNNRPVPWCGAVVRLTYSLHGDYDIMIAVSLYRCTVRPCVTLGRLLQLQAITIIIIFILITNNTTTITAYFYYD